MRALSERSETELEFPEVRKKLEEYCQTPPGRKGARETGPTADPEQVRSWQEETGEVRGELEQGWEIPSLAAVSEIEPLLLRVRKGAVLRPEELLQVTGVLDAAGAVRRYLRSRAGALARVRERFGRLAGIPGLQDRVQKTIEPSGRIRDRASSELSRLRKRKDSIEEEIKERIQELILSPALEEVLQDKYFTLRIGRYVLPVKTERRSDLKGIIHDFSSSGATVYIEPEVIVDRNNLLRVAEGEVIQEEERILKELTRLVEEQLEEIKETYSGVGEFDLLLARARLSRVLGGGEIQISEFPYFQLRSGRHPLLVLQGSEVVDNDLSLERGRLGIIISGPNTGGKTVTLKMLGLSAALFQSGITPALGNGSSLPVFRQILAVIGEEQSLQKGLSAFAAEVLRVREVMEEVGPGSLVLLDDLFGGTDPREGAGLARALLEKLVERGGVVMVTTHFPELKLLPLEDDRFEAAAVEFDLGKIVPTYRLRAGFPGRSYGLEIAGRLGLGEEIVSAAASGLEGAESGAEKILARLHELEEETVRVRDEARREKYRLEEARAGLETEREQIEGRKGEILAQAREEFKAVVRKMETEAREIMKKMAGVRTRKQADEARRELKSRVEELGREAGLADPGPEPAPGGKLREKGAVWIKSLQKQGSVVSLGAEESLVQVGSLKIRAKNQDLVPVAEKAGAAQAKPKPERGRGWKKAVLEDRKESVDLRSEENTVDLRGETVEDGLQRLEQFLDQAFLQGLGQVFVIHGSGSGRLREGIRKYLQDSRYAESFQAAEQEHGGEGVTVVNLK